MRRPGDLFSLMCSFGNLVSAAANAQRGKRYRTDVLRFNLHREDHLHALRDRLRCGTWRPSPHRHFKIYEPKARWISAAPYEDRVVHHALCNVIGPVVDRRFIYDSWANRLGKGSHRAVLRLQQFAGRHRYALTIDLQRYFPSIDHQVLKRQLRARFKDRRLVRVMESIVDHGRIPEPQHEYYPGDDLFAPFERITGLPIGNLTSQLWANVYLDDFDHWVKERLRTKAYLRFVDDFVLLHDDRETLHVWERALTRRLALLRLRPHPRKSVVRPTAEGVPFLGYVVWPTRIRVRGETVRRFRRRHRREAVRDPVRARAGLVAWAGHAGWAGTYRRTEGG